MPDMTTDAKHFVSDHHLHTNSPPPSRPRSLHRVHSQASQASQRGHVLSRTPSHTSSIGDAAVPYEPPPTAQDVGPPPDGGRDAWLCIFSTFFHLFCVFGLLTSSGELQRYYLDHQLKGYSKATAAWISAIQPLFVFSAAVFTGRYFDVHGARFGAVGGTIVAFIAVMGLAFSQKYYQLLLSHMCFGIAGCLVYAPSTAVAGHWFLKRRAEAVGIIVAGSGLGGVIYPIMLNHLFKQLSFRDTMIIVACFNLALMIPACFWMKARLPPRTPPPLSTLKKPWTEPRYIFLNIGTMLYAFGLLSGYFNAPNLAISAGASQVVIENSVAILQAGSFVGRVAAGMLADRLGVWNVFGSIPFLTAITYYAFWTAAPGDAVTIIGLILFGAFSGGWFTLAAAATAAISPVSEVGARIGMMWSGIAIPALLGPVICGQLIVVADNSFVWAGVFCGTATLLSGIFTIGPPLLAWVRGGMCFGGRRHSDLEKEVGEVPESGVTTPAVQAERWEKGSAVHDRDAPAPAVPATQVHLEHVTK